MVEIRDYFRDSVVIITGGAGSVGSRLALKLAEYGPRSIRIFDSDENGLFNLQLSIPEKQKHIFRFFLGDIRDKQRLDRAVEGTDYVYHLAALKHVSIGNYNPFELVKTNIEGTQNILESVLNARTVRKFIFFSSDKAADPTNPYGISKHLAEKLTIAAASYRGDRPTEFCCLRFGNIKGTRGSVWHVWEREIKNGEPLTVTDPRMKRFFITMEDAVRFTIGITPLIKDGDIIVPKMRESNIQDLAKKFGREIVITKPAVGEKMEEVLISADELAEDCGKYWRIRG